MFTAPSCCGAHLSSVRHSEETPGAQCWIVMDGVWWSGWKEVKVQGSHASFFCLLLLISNHSSSLTPLPPIAHTHLLYITPILSKRQEAWTYWVVTFIFQCYRWVLNLVVKVINKANCKDTLVKMVTSHELVLHSCDTQWSEQKQNTVFCDS